MTRFEEFKNRMTSSLVLPRGKLQQELRQEYWSGYLRALCDHAIVTLDEYKELDSLIRAGGQV